MLLFWGAFGPGAARAQPETPPPVSFDVGADLVSRYVWRGLALGTSPSIQPSIALQAGALQVGTWGNYSLTTDGSNAAEHDVWLGYAADLGGGRLTLTLFDYHFPSPASPYFDWQGGGDGSHTLEASAHYLLSSRFPAYVLVARNVYNDPDGSWYLEAGYAADVQDVRLDISAGLTRGASAWYGVPESKLALLNVQLRLSKSLALTERLSLPLSAAFVLNPYAEQTHLVFGLTL